MSHMESLDRAVWRSNARTTIEAMEDTVSHAVIADALFEVAYEHDKEDELATHTATPIHAYSEEVARVTSYHWTSWPQVYQDQVQQYMQARQQTWRATDTTVPSSPYQATHGGIRVLRLAPGTGEDRLSGSLIHVDVNLSLVRSSAEEARYAALPVLDFGISLDGTTRISYTAISYCWGLGGMTHVIDIGGHDIRVTATVDAILRQLRHQTRYGHVWIDQVCIDQQDILDKQEQVQMMGKIYARAQSTLIWLGHGPENGCFELMRTIADSRYGNLSEDISGSEMSRAVLSSSECDAWAALNDLFRSPWCRRTWIIQEAALSVNPFLMFGGKTISFTDFAGWCVDVSSYILFDGEAADGFKCFVAIWNHAMRSFSSVGNGLRDWLQESRYAETTLAVDKVYGVLGLCDSIDVTVDYSVTAQSLFTSIAKEILSEHSMDVWLSNLDHDPELTGMPSWVVDWSQKRMTTAIAGRSGCRSPYNADELCGLRLLVVDNCLPLYALFVDTLELLSEVAEDAELVSTSPLENNASLREAVAFANVRNVEYTAFCATLVAGRDSTGCQRYPFEFEEVLSLLCDETTGRKPSLTGQTYSKRQLKGHFTLKHLARRTPLITFRDLKKAYKNAMLNRRLAWGKLGNFGLVPRFARSGDQLAIIPGCPVPYILRAVEGERFMMIGEAYFHDLMDGSWFQANHRGLEMIKIC